MSEIDKKKIGNFLSELRKEKGLTQKELAEQLYISSKAISKWETGVSIPHVDMLLPLANILDVTVTELLKGERIEKDQPISKEKVEELVRQAVVYSEDEKEKLFNHSQYVKFFLLSFIITIIEIIVLFDWSNDKYDITDFLPFIFVAIVIGFYFTFIVKERIPLFYDENKISFYTDGIMRIHLPGLYINNHNWSYICQYVRIWSYISAILTPIFFYILLKFIPMQIAGYLFLFFTLISLFFPMYYIGKKHE